MFRRPMSVTAVGKVVCDSPASNDNRGAIRPPVHAASPLDFVKRFQLPMTCAAVVKIIYEKSGLQLQPLSNSPAS